jgi:hypothetical protein
MPKAFLIRKKISAKDFFTSAHWRPETPPPSPEEELRNAAAAAAATAAAVAAAASAAAATAASGLSAVTSALSAPSTSGLSPMVSSAASSSHHSTASSSNAGPSAPARSMLTANSPFLSSSSSMMLPPAHLSPVSSAGAHSPNNMMFSSPNGSSLLHSSMTNTPNHAHLELQMQKMSFDSNNNSVAMDQHNRAAATAAAAAAAAAAAGFGLFHSPLLALNLTCPSSVLRRSQQAEHDEIDDDDEDADDDDEDEPNEDQCLDLSKNSHTHQFHQSRLMQQAAVSAAVSAQSMDSPFGSISSPFASSSTLPMHLASSLPSPFASHASSLFSSAVLKQNYHHSSPLSSVTFGDHSMHNHLLISSGPSSIGSKSSSPMLMQMNEHSNDSHSSGASSGLFHLPVSVDMNIPTSGTS